MRHEETPGRWTEARSKALLGPATACFQDSFGEEGPLDSRENRRRAPGAALLILSLAGCWHGLEPGALPWCARPVELPEGRLHPAGILEPRPQDGEDPVDRLYLRVAREAERLGLGLARLPAGEVVVADLVRGGPAARAGLRQGMRLAGPADDLEALLRRFLQGTCWIDREGRAVAIALAPGDRLLGRRRLFIPLLIDWEADQAGLSWVAPLGLARLSWRQEEIGQGRLESEGRLALFWGLVRL